MAAGDLIMSQTDGSTPSFPCGPCCPCNLSAVVNITLAEVIFCTDFIITEPPYSYKITGWTDPNGLHSLNWTSHCEGGETENLVVGTYTKDLYKQIDPPPAPPTYQSTETNDLVLFAQCSDGVLSTILAGVLVVGNFYQNTAMELDTPANNEIVCDGTTSASGEGGTALIELT